MNRFYKRLSAFILAALVISVTWGMLAPISSDSREKLLEIPDGTWESRTSGKEVDIFPPVIRLTLGVKDILVVRNLDKVPQLFGSALLMPGQSIRLPLRQAGESSMVCAAHASGQITIIVDREPTAGWRRLTWRLKRVMQLL